MSTNGMVVKLHNKIDVKARRRLGDPEVFDAMIEELQSMIQEMQTSGREPFIGDLDIAQNHVSALEFETLFQTLSACGVRVERFRMFGCPTLDDEALGHVGNYFRMGLTPDSVPTEVHLSDCAITSRGFTEFIEAIEESELYPFEDKRSGKSLPLYLRLESNYIDEAVIQDQVDAGVIRAYTKQATGHRSSTDAAHKVDLVVMTGRPGFQQKEGAPPAPEDAPPPKRVFDEKGKDKGKGKGKDDKGKGKKDRRTDYSDRDSRGGDRERTRNSDRDRRGKDSPNRGIPLWGNTGAVGAVGARPSSRDDRAPLMRPSREGSGQETHSKDAPWRKPDRYDKDEGSRRPRSRSRGAKGSGRATDNGVGKPSQPPRPSSRLPASWEEHWSDEHKVHYFWNSKTGDSTWERPKM